MLAGAEPAARPVDPDHAAKMARGLDLFQQHVRPVLVDKCLKCHSGKEPEGGLDLSARATLLKGGRSGPAVVAGNAKESRLFQLVSHAKKPPMPREGPKLPDAVLAHIAAWIDNGAPYDEPLTVSKTPGPNWTQRKVTTGDRTFWSFQPLGRGKLPVVKKEGWIKTPLDRFILAKLEAAGIEPNPAVERRQLVRRVYFDLIGLPPTPEQLDAAQNDQSDEWLGKVVDELLTSPHYGERWGRHWLDLARFAESHGFEHDYDRPTAYHYRDFVIKALNTGMPYDQFVKWQLAGDEYAPDDLLAWMATGFLAAGVHSTQITKNEVERHRYDEMDDMLATVGTSMLGLTLGCARCHDHKFDPIPQADYYRLLATFTTTVRSEIEINLDPESLRKAKAAFDREHAPLVAALQQFEKEQLPARLVEWEKTKTKPADPKLAPSKAVELLLQTPAEKRTAEQQGQVLAWYRTIDPQWQKLNQAVQEHLKKEPKPPLALVSGEGLKPVRLHTQGEDFLPETHFLRRGDPNRKEGVAPAGFLQVLMTAPEKQWQQTPPAGSKTSYRRRALAEWLTDVEHGAGALLARVIVNRLWQHHMGRGLVATPSDFGERGERPTHPDLLDYLADELIKNGWQLKPIHKLIVTSAVYAQSSAIDEDKAAKDRDNRLCWRRPRHRLEAEVVRDAMLAVSGLLDRRQFGPGTLDEASKRRSIYFTVKRSKIMPMMGVFDAPDALQGIGDRPTTTIAPQALMLLNNAQVRGCAAGLARRAGAAATEEAVRTGYATAVARPPNAEEIADAVAFLKAQTGAYRAAGKTNAPELALTDFCQVLLCLNDFVYVD